jgi:hemoglobin
MDQNLFASVGEEGFARLVAGFYARVKRDPLLSPLYPPLDWAGAEQRLRDFLVGRFGGPPRYVESRGHPRLRMRHAPFPIDQRARDRWFLLMSASLDEAGLGAQETAFLRQFFDEVATFLINRAGDDPVAPPSPQFP